MFSYYSLATFPQGGVTLSFVIIFAFLVYFVIKEKGYNKLLMLIPIVEIISFFIGIYLSTQGTTEKIIANLLSQGYKSIGYLLFYLLIYKLDNRISEDKLEFE